MRIALFCHKFWPAVGGLCTYTGRLAEYLIEQGHEVNVFTTRVPAGTPAHEPQSPRLTIRRFTTRLANHPPFYFAPALIAEAIADEVRQADVIHSVGYYFFPSVFGHFVAHTFRSPHVSTPVYTLNPASWQRATFDSALGRSLVYRARHVIPQSQHEAELMERARFRFPARTIIPFGVDSALFAPDYDVADLRVRHGIGDGERVLLFVGKIMSPKGAFDCLDVLAKVQSSERRLRLVMIGEIHPAESAIFRRRIQDLRLEHAVTLTGPLTDRTEIARYYQLADVVLFPSQYEQFGIVAIEAAASGRPLIGTPVGVMKSLVPQLDYGLLHPFGDLDRFAEHLCAVLESDRYRANAVRHRREILEQYSWRRIAEQTERVYAAVTERSR